MIPSMSSEFDCFETCAWSMNEAPWNVKRVEERYDPYGSFLITLTVFLKLRWELSDNPPDVF